MGLCFSSKSIQTDTSQQSCTVRTDNRFSDGEIPGRKPELNQNDTSSRTQSTEGLNHNEPADIGNNQISSYNPIQGSVSQPGSGPSHQEYNDRCRNEVSPDTSTTPRSGLVHSYNNSRTSALQRESVQSILTPTRVIVQSDESFKRTYLDKHNVFELPNAQFTRNITDSIELEDGRLILCDNNNKELLLFDGSMELKATHTFLANPYNIASVTSNRIAITMPEEVVIKMVDIEGSRLVDPKEDVPAKTNCKGIKQINGQLWYTCETRLYVNEAGARRPFELERAFKQPVSLVTGFDWNTLYVCCRGKTTRGDRGEIVTMNTATHQTIPTLFNEYIEEPVSCTAAKDGLLFVCDMKLSPIIHVVDNGVYSHCVLGSTTEKFQHIRYLRQKDEFLIAENDSNSLGFYKLKEALDQAPGLSLY